uniref:Uncharacterized protein n=1 Tax=Kalanchoe fedtschenkoi TaxID=63787 RepID=A0A7N0VEC7_KALFE
MSLLHRRLLTGAATPSDLRIPVRQLPRSPRFAAAPFTRCRNGMTVRQPARSRPTLVLVRAGGGVGSGGDGEERSGRGRAAEVEESEARRDRAAEVAVAAGLTVVLGVGNRVLYKLALVPLKNYPFFLAQFATFGYVVVYFTILYFRYKRGIVTDEMLSLPKAPFVVVGLLEALGAATGMAAGAILSGASIPILSQSFLVWQILLSAIFLGRRYRVNQLLGCFLVAAGVIITVASGSSSGSLKEVGIWWSVLMITSFLFQAADTVLKEIIFLDATQRLKGGSVDLFVVNSYGSAFQCRHYSFAFSCPFCRTYGEFPSANCRAT